MNASESFSISNCAKQMRLAECELSAFMTAVAKLFGPEQARLCAEDWLTESELIDGPPPSSKFWRTVTVAASASVERCGESRDCDLSITNWTRKLH